MNQDFVFSWAENFDGQMVHIDSVPRGLSCGCVCPYCHEKLLARHGDIREHGFAHHSDNRGANLEICYMVSLYKLAEQIIQINKRIHVPSYYGIYEETDIKFIDVKVDSRFEREDKQPDIIAVTNDQKQYLIEFIFKYKVQHKQAVDYKNLSCLEIDISNQTLDSLESFLLSSKDDRRWINNDIYFNCIENKYKKEGKIVKVVSENDCSQCKLKHSCCAVMTPHLEYPPLCIENNGQKYRICKIEQYDKAIEALRRREYSQEKQYCKQNHNETETNLSETESSVSERSCFNCKSNLTWKNRGDGWAHCGCYQSMGLPRGKVAPDYAKECRGFRTKIRP